MWSLRTNGGVITVSIGCNPKSNKRNVCGKAIGMKV